MLPYILLNDDLTKMQIDHKKIIFCEGPYTCGIVHVDGCVNIDGTRPPDRDFPPMIRQHQDCVLRFGTAVEHFRLAWEKRTLRLEKDTLNYKDIPKPRDRPTLFSIGKYKSQM